MLLPRRVVLTTVLCCFAATTAIILYLWPPSAPSAETLSNLLPFTSPAAFQRTRPASHKWTLQSHANVEAVHPTDNVTWPYRIFKTSPLRPPILEVSTIDDDAYDEMDPAPLFVTAQRVSRDPVTGKDTGTLDRAPYILDTRTGELIFSPDVEEGIDVGNFGVQTYHGRPHLVFWRGLLTQGPQVGHGYGEVVVLDAAYGETRVQLRDPQGRLHRNLEPEEEKALEALGDGMYADLHEAQISPSGTVLVPVYNNTPTSGMKTDANTPAWVADGVIYEIDVATSEVVWRWTASEHIPFSDTFFPRDVSARGEDASSAPWDWIHLNSAAAVDDEHVLINARNTWTFYVVHKPTGRIVWQLCGADKGWPAEIDGMRWAHHVRIVAQTHNHIDVSLFDNYRNITKDFDSAPSRGMTLRIPLPSSASSTTRIDPSTLTLLQLDTLPYANAATQGSYQPSLPHTKNAFVAFGDKTYGAEFSPRGDFLATYRYGYDMTVASYRALRGDWVGWPVDTRPSVHVEVPIFKNGGASGGLRPVKVSVSWNGATEVVGWDALARQQGEREWTQVGRARKKGFETVILAPLMRGRVCVVVEAVFDEAKRSEDEEARARSVEVGKSAEICLDVPGA